MPITTCDKHSVSGPKIIILCTTIISILFYGKVHNCDKLLWNRMSNTKKILLKTSSFKQQQAVSIQITEISFWRVGGREENNF